LKKLPPDNRETFKLYKRAEKTLAKKLEKLAASKERFEKLYSMAENTEKTLKEALQTEKLTKEAVEKLEADDPMVNKAKQIYLSGLALEALKNWKKYIEDQEKYQFER